LIGLPNKVTSKCRKGFLSCAEKNGGGEPWERGKRIAKPRGIPLAEGPQNLPLLKFVWKSPLTVHHDYSLIIDLDIGELFDGP
jgi:hypothetical protein